MADETLDVLIRMRGGRAFAAEARVASGEVERLATSTRRQGAAARGASAESGALSRSWGAMTSSTGGLATAMGGLAANAGAAGARLAGVTAAGTVWLGLRFNSTMEQNTVAFTHFLGSVQASRDYLDRLYNLAAHTPFEFADITDAARKLIAFGSSSEEAIKQLRTLGDAASGLGTGREGINRMVIALGQMQAAGVVQGDELRQFQEAGINVYKYMIAAGLITRDDIGKIGDMHIDAAKAIDAIMKGMQRDFGGLSRQQAKTWQGQLSTIKDYAAQAAGALTKPLFDVLRQRVFPRIGAQLQKVATWARGNPLLPGGGGVNQAIGDVRAGFQGTPAPRVDPRRARIAERAGGLPVPPGQVDAMQKVGQVARQVFDQIVMPAFNTAKGAVLEFWDALKPIQPFIANVLGPLLLGFAGGTLGALVVAWRIFIFVLRLTTTVLGYIGQKLAFARGFFVLLGTVISFVAGPSALGLLGRGLGLLGRLLGEGGIAARSFGVILRFASVIVHGLVIVLQVAAAVVGAVFARAFRIAGSVIGGVFSRMRGTAGDAVAWIQLRFEALIGFFRRMPGRIRSAASGMWNGLVSAFKAAINLIIAGWNGLDIGIGPAHIKVPGPLPDINIPRIGISTPNIPLLQAGGLASGPGSFIAGEAGAELVTLDADQGARVEPLQAKRQQIQLVLPDGRVLFEWLVREGQSQVARS